MLLTVLFILLTYVLSLPLSCYTANHVSDNFYSHFCDNVEFLFVDSFCMRCDE